MTDRYIPLERLRNMNVDRKLLFTDAIEPRAEQFDFDPRGLDQVLLNRGFRYHNEGTGPPTTWMRAPEEDGDTNIWYRRGTNMHREVFGSDDRRMRTRIDFFSKMERSDSMYVAAEELLKAGYHVLVPGSFVSQEEYGDGLVEVKDSVSDS